MFLKQSTGVTINFGPFLDKTDGVTLEVGLVSALDHATTGIMISKNGGVLAVRTAGFTATAYDAHGCYRVTLGTTDTNTLGKLRVIYTDAATCLPVWLDYEIVPAMIYDSIIAGTDALDTSVIQWLGTAVTADTAGHPKVTIKDGTGQGELLTTLGKIDNVTLVDTATTVTNQVTAAAMADAVWDEDATAHQTGGTFGQAIGDPVADTNTIYKAVVTDAAGATVAIDVAAVKADTATIAVDTAEIGIAGAGLTVLATQASVNTIDDFLDTEVAAIKAKTDQLVFTGANRVDANVEAINNDTEAADDLQKSAKTIVSGAAIAGTLSTTQMSTNLTEATNDHYNGRVIIWTSGALIDQATDITDYAGATKVLTFTAITEAPSAGDTFVIV